MDEFYLGEIQLFAFGFAPMEFMPCSGQLMQINSNQALYSLLGARFGGDCVSTFQLPDLRKSIPLQIPSYMQYYICTNGIYPTRD